MPNEKEHEQRSPEEFDQDAEQEVVDRFLTATGEFDLDQFLEEIKRQLEKGEPPDEEAGS